MLDTWPPTHCKLASCVRGAQRGQSVTMAHVAPPADQDHPAFLRWPPLQPEQIPVGSEADRSQRLGLQEVCPEGLWDADAR